MLFPETLVLIKGAGDLATGVAYRLFRSGFPLLMTEIREPLMVRHAVSFGQAVYDGETTVEGMTARRVEDAQDFIKRALDSNPKAQMMIAVPYEHPQHGVGGNTHERHLQEDLNKENFLERYPDFELAILLKSPSKRKEFSGGYYLRKGSFEKPV